MDAVLDGGAGVDMLDVQGEEPLPTGSRLVLNATRGIVLARTVDATATVGGAGQSLRLTVGWIGG